MTQPFITDDFLLDNDYARKLYHEVAKHLPIIDYHCHLPVDEIAGNKMFKNLTEIWLYGDHYKWRAMRTNGVDERFCTGDASDLEKFLAWAATVPQTLRNPLYHWTHMELKRPFGIEGLLLNTSTAMEVWERCNALLNTPEFTTRGLISQFNVKVVCTTDDPLDDLRHHEAIKKSGFSTVVLPAFRPDKAMMVENLNTFVLWFNKLQELTGSEIKSFEAYLAAIKARHDFFHENGCRLSDHGIETAYAEEYTAAEIEKIFAKILIGKNLNGIEILKFKSAMMYEFGMMDHARGWVQQLHLGALRNNSSRMYRTLGPDTGFDSIGDFKIARPLAKFLNKLDDQNRLAKTILYNLNPSDNELFATMIGNFQDGTVPGKLQYGAAWWFLDQKDGMEKQMNALSALGLLSRFIGMLTDSRSFLSYSRHEYFRRLLCNMIGSDITNGLIPNSDDILIPMVENICYYNAAKYFDFGLSVQ
jgi:glucuronate isomerase